MKAQSVRHAGTKKRNMKFRLLSKKEESIAEKIVGAAFTVYKVLGRGKRLGFLINFNVPPIKNGINRIIL